ncbi:LysE family translocator [Planococcus lenghuensis]|uniref:Threonine transporter RhtB n=1 Tax=Planococcus lenghuensis TaxID=2213202 RepID=A0A1Q2L3X2_9BACL|nr:LysE family translocator [Planococcus lenghuensis]AQQ54572.1 threonine transporter RhtB [Planococcus lenghuensis]
MDLTSVISFLGAAVLLTLMPGPDNLFVLAQSIAQDKKAGIATALGLCSGLIAHITAAAIGISAIVYQSAVAFAIVKYAGAAYLLYLACQSFRAGGGSFDLKARRALDYPSLYKRGVIMNLLNPKVSLFFLALFPQFIDYSAGSISLQMIGYGFLFIIQALVIFSLISVFAGEIGRFLNRSPAMSRKLNVLQGALFTLIGISIAFGEK